jgi:hypothetical protein
MCFEILYKREFSFRHIHDHYVITLYRVVLSAFDHIKMFMRKLCLRVGVSFRFSD